MAETEERKKGKNLGLSRPGKLELKKTVETGQVRQNFSHGRARMVTVEVRKKRTFAPDAGGQMAEVPEEQEQVEEAPELDVAKPVAVVPAATPAQAALAGRLATPHAPNSPQASALGAPSTTRPRLSA